MLILTTVGSGGRVHFASAEVGAIDEGVPMCGSQAWGLPRCDRAVDCSRCSRIFAERRATLGGTPVAYATLLPARHPARSVPSVGDVVAVDGDHMQIVAMIDLRPHGLAEVVLDVLSLTMVRERRRAGVPLRGDRVVGLADVAGYAGRRDLHGGDMFHPASGLPADVILRAVT